MWNDYAGEGYGFGFELQQTPVGKTVGHGGGFPGLNSHLDIQPESGYIVAVMSNYDMGAEALRGYLLGMLSGQSSQICEVGLRLFPSGFVVRRFQ